LIDNYPAYEVIWDFIQTHLTYINRERRVNDDRIEGLNALLNFTIENLPFLAHVGILDDLREITAKLLRANSETSEVADDKLHNVTNMTQRIEIEIDLLRAEEIDVG